MRIALHITPGFMEVGGGGPTVVRGTAQSLAKAGVDVTLWNQWEQSLREFDIVQIFGLHRHDEPVVTQAKAQGTKVAIVPIFWRDWDTLWGQTEGELAARLRGFYAYARLRLFSHLGGPIRRILEGADVLFPNSRAEARMLNKFFPFVGSSRMHVVPNAVEASFADAEPGPFMHTFGLDKFILHVGFFSPRKNQLRLIRAMKDSRHPVVFIGKAASPVHEEYYRRCRRAATGNMHFLGAMASNSEMLKSAYAAARVFAFPSICETPGLAALEAALAGCSLAITTGGSTREYFRDYVTYVSPVNLNSIRDGVEKAAEAGPNPLLTQHILQNFTWDRVTEKLVLEYRRLLGKTASP